MTREPAVCGEFYESSFEQLNKQIEDCFYSKKGPGDLPAKRNKGRITAIIVPHAGYYFSGPCAAWSYMEIAESEFPDAFLILGPNHHSTGSGLSAEDWKTPFGIIRVDKETAKELAEHTDLSINEKVHAPEHSIEVQLPFLQYVNKDRIKDIKIIPVVIGMDIDYKLIGRQIYEYFGKTNKKIIIIISSDFTHYGRNYHYLPFTSDVPQRITDLDKGAIDTLLNLDTVAFNEYINKTGITICGYMPILVFLAMMDHYAEKPKANLLMHYTSGDVLGDYRNSVSYVSMVFRQLSHNENAFL